MQYALLINDDEKIWEAMSEEDQAAMYSAYEALTVDLQNSGVLVAGTQLQPSPSACTVRVRDGERTVSEGPSIDSKEHLGGYYVIDVQSVDEAVEWAAKVPSATIGSIEIRPVVTTAD